MLELRNISFSYKTLIPFKKTNIINNLSLKFDKGIYLIIAPNGWGKTTLLKIIKGFLIPDSGEIFINKTKTDFKNYPSNYFSLFSNPIRSLYPQLTILENIKLFLTLEDIKINKERIYNLATMLKIENYLTKKFEEVSTGTAAKAIFLKIFMEEKDFILLDEPFANIDDKSSELIKNHIKKIENNKIIIIATSKKSEVEGFINEKNILYY